MRRSIRNYQERSLIKAKKFSRGFTLVELLVVIAIIALLMSVLMPALARVRKQARATLCQARLKQLGTCFSMYAGENDSYFPPGWTHVVSGYPQWYWMEALRACYGGAGDLRLCPMATNIGSESGAGEYNSGAGATTWTAWGYFRGPAGAPSTAWPWVIGQDYGSYGWNSFVCNMPDFIGDAETGGSWDMPPSVFNWKRADVKGSGRIPLLGDHKWLDCWPFHGDEAPEWDGQTWNQCSQMGRICMNRHDGYVNWVFLDYAVRKVGLKELWKLQWSKKYDTTDTPTNWPDWMKGLKEYK